MSLRKEVFQAKVLRRLYPAAAKAENVLALPSPNPKSATPSGGVQLQPNNATGRAGECRQASRKVYTVLPPPDDYRPSSGDGWKKPAGAESTSADRDPATDLSGSDNQDGSEDEEVRRRRRRRRKKKRKAEVVSEFSEAEGTSTLPPGGDAARQTGVGAVESRVLEGPGQLSKNKKRKLKKKRHKEKLLSLGLMPRPRALEFTYTQGGDREREDVEDRHAESRQSLAELLDFLRNTWSLYISDRSSAAGRTLLDDDVAESLFTRMSDVSSPPTGLLCLRRLGARLGQREVGQLSPALQEFSSTSTLPADETAVVCSLFHYWITEVLPIQKERDT